MPITDWITVRKHVFMKTVTSASMGPYEMAKSMPGQIIYLPNISVTCTVVAANVKLSVNIIFFWWCKSVHNQPNYLLVNHQHHLQFKKIKQNLHYLSKCHCHWKTWPTPIRLHQNQAFRTQTPQNSMILSNITANISLNSRNYSSHQTLWKGQCINLQQYAQVGVTSLVCDNEMPFSWYSFLKCFNRMCCFSCRHRSRYTIRRSSHALLFTCKQHSDSYILFSF